MDKPGLVDLAIAPLTWLERASGWKRGALLLLYVMVLMVGSVVGWRAFSLWRLPDIGEPFDLDKYGIVDVPEDSSGRTLYRRAEAKLITGASSLTVATPLRAWFKLDWATATPELRRWAVLNRGAFELWLEATERPDSFPARPKDAGDFEIYTAGASLQNFANLAMLEASRLSLSGDVEGAWRLYLAALRTSRHAGMHGGTAARQVGLGILNTLRPVLRNWGDDPRVTTEQLRRAIVDLKACKSMTPPDSERVRADYVAIRAALDHPLTMSRYDGLGREAEAVWHARFPVLRRVRHFLMREPERSRRILKLIFAGQLAQCDRPAEERPGVISKKYTIYAVDARTPPAVAAIAPEELEAFADRSALTAIWIDSNAGWATLASEPGIFDALLIRMAERAYEAEHGRPPTTYSDLVGPYLKALPDGIAGADRISAASGPE